MGKRGSSSTGPALDRPAGQDQRANSLRRARWNGEASAQAGSARAYPRTGPDTPAASTQAAPAPDITAAHGDRNNSTRAEIDWEARSELRLRRPGAGRRGAGPRRRRGARSCSELPGPEMAGEAEHRVLGVFECQLCALTAPYSYMGQKPPTTQSVVLLEESYVMKDPFSSDKATFLVLGSRCGLCSRLVCVGPECSLFYAKRFCLPCVQQHLSAFPQEIQQDVEKRTTPSKKISSQRRLRT